MPSTFFTFTALLLATASATPVLYARQSTSISGFAYQGCFTEATGQRALIGKTFFDDLMTLDKCASACSSFSYFGVEYGRECYCSSSGLNAGSVSALEDECSFDCPGKATQRCGAGNRLNVYSKSTETSPSATSSATSIPTSPPTSFQGCYTDNTAHRALYEANFYDDEMTVEFCGTICDGYKYFGLEYGRECWCGNTLRDSAAAAAEECNFPCPGNAQQICGAGDRLSLYTLSVSPPVSSSTTTSSLESLSESTTASSTEASTTASTTEASTTESPTTTTSTTTSAAPVQTCLSTSPITNSGFEDGYADLATGWEPWMSELAGNFGRATDAVTTPHNGVKSYQVLVTALNRPQRNAFKQEFTSPLCIGRTYNYVAWVKVPAGTLPVPINIATSETYIGGSFASDTGTWTKLEGSFTPADAEAASSLYVTMLFPINTGELKVFFDDITVTLA